MSDKATSAGDRMKWTNTTGSKVNSGDVVVLTDGIGVALGDIPDTETGVLMVSGVHELPKASVSLGYYEFCYWDGSQITNSSTGNDGAGVSFQDVASGDSTVEVKINEVAVA